jgi:hypothetical protein
MELARRVASPGWGSNGRPRRLSLAGSASIRADEAAVCHLMDVAHAALGSEDLAAVLVVVLRETQLMRRGSLPARPRGRLREGRPSLTPAARAFLRPIRLALDEVARAAMRAGIDEIAALGERVGAHAELLAALPRSCAVVMPPPAAGTA